MSDWSKPEKNAAGKWKSRCDERPHGGYLDEVELNASGIDCSEIGSYRGAPRDVVLRLLAAEASERLGWFWVDIGHLRDGSGRRGFRAHYCTWSCGPAHPMVCNVADGTTLKGDEVVAALHGLFLLEDAMKEASEKNRGEGSE